MRIERLVPCPPEDLWRALIQNTELGKHGAMLRLALPGGLSRPRGRSRSTNRRGCSSAPGRRRAALGAPAARLARLVFTTPNAPRNGWRTSKASKRSPRVGRGASRRVICTAQPIVLRPGKGRSYPMGRISALFKADGAETAGRYSISEWWLEPAHARARWATRRTTSFRHRRHDELSARRRMDARGRGFVRPRAGRVTHDFENRGSARAGVLNISVPGRFEEDMPSIAQWFAGTARRWLNGVLRDVENGCRNQPASFDYLTLHTSEERQPCVS